ncbi:response regulator transcription factor [Treponema sp. R80B11-R83G3]
MEFTPVINFFLAFITSVGYYRLFFTINRPTVRWRFFVMFAVVILSFPLSAVWQFQYRNIPEPSDVFLIVSFFFNFFPLLACALLGHNRLRALVAAVFVLSIIYTAEIPVVNYTAAVVNSFFTKLDSSDAIGQNLQRYYLMFFLFNLIVMCSCFLAARWLRKTKEKPPIKTSVCFCLFFIFFIIIIAVFHVTTWFWSRLAFMPSSFLGLALHGTLLVCIPFFALFFYSRLTVQREPVSPIPDTARAGYAQFIGQLSKRELEVIEAVLAGCVSQKELASLLNISVNTVKKHLQHIYQTTGSANMTALTVLFSGYLSNNPKG